MPFGDLSVPSPPPPLDLLTSLDILVVLSNVESVQLFIKVPLPLLFVGLPLLTHCVVWGCPSAHGALFPLDSGFPAASISLVLSSVGLLLTPLSGFFILHILVVNRKSLTQVFLKLLFFSPYTAGASLSLLEQMECKAGDGV